MTKDVIVCLSGLQYDINQEEPVESMSIGEYEKIGEDHAIRYEEYTDDGAGGQLHHRNVLTIGRDRVELTKEGDSEAHLIFSRNQRTENYYHTPFGDLQIGMDTREISTKVGKSSLEAKITYGLELNGEFISNCEIAIRVQEKA